MADDDGTGRGDLTYDVVVRAPGGKLFGHSRAPGGQSFFLNSLRTLFKFPNQGSRPPPSARCSQVVHATTHYNDYLPHNP